MGSILDGNYGLALVTVVVLMASGRAGSSGVTVEDVEAAGVAAAVTVEAGPCSHLIQNAQPCRKVKQLADNQRLRRRSHVL